MTNDVVVSKVGAVLRVIAVAVVATTWYGLLGTISGYLSFTPAYYASEWAQRMTEPFADVWFMDLVLHAQGWYMETVLPALAGLLTGLVFWVYRSCRAPHFGFGGSLFAVGLITVWGVESVPTYVGILLFFTSLVAVVSVRNSRQAATY